MKVQCPIVILPIAIAGKLECWVLDSNQSRLGLDRPVAAIHHQMRCQMAIVRVHGRRLQAIGDQVLCQMVTWAVSHYPVGMVSVARQDLEHKYLSTL